jgi:hypothetical protein
MSVAHFNAVELGSVAAAAVKAGIAPLGEMVDILSSASAANCAAYSATYEETASAVDSDDIEALALDILSGKLPQSHWGALVYNCISNGGTLFLPEETAARLREIEEATRKVDDTAARVEKRAKENAVSYNDCPRQRTATEAELLAAMAAAGADRVIMACFTVDESDIQSDYHGGRTARTVVIGLGRGKRESFAQLRQAAGRFKPTAEYGPGLGQFFAYVVLGADCRGGGGVCYWKGSRSPWHREHDGGPFVTRAAAVAHASATVPAIIVDGTPVPLEWSISEDPIEHRENYSMGGGNCLGRRRYGGWTVKSQAYLPATAEVFSVEAFGGKPARKR